MQKFVERHQDKITGTLSCFDRLIFHGHLNFRYAEAMEHFLQTHNILFKDFKDFVTAQAERLKKHAQDFAAQEGRSYTYLNSYLRKEDRAKEIAEQEGITQGLVCVFSTLEPCRCFKLIYGQGRPRLEATKRTCLVLYFYFLDRTFGLMHLRLQTWFPFQIQIALNGHDWLARKLDRHQISYQQIENAFTWIADPERAQKFADRFVDLNWPGILQALARKVNPLFQDLLHHLEYYWVADQSEFATDLMFKDQTALQHFYPKLLQHSTLCFSAEDVLAFLGRKLHPRFAGQVLNDCKHRLPGARVKHKMKDNWIKMYDKFGCVLRIETVINHPYEFQVRRTGKRKGQTVTAWLPMTKGVANLYRYAQVSLAANSRYLDALAVVEDPSKAYRFLHHLCEPAAFNGRMLRGFNPLSKADVQLFAAVMRGEHSLRGFRNKDLLPRLLPEASTASPPLLRRLIARVSRLLQRLRAHGLIAKFPRARRYRVTTKGFALMSAALLLRDQTLPRLLLSA